MLSTGNFDCSGADGGVKALKELLGNQGSVKLLSTSDIGKAPLKFLMRNNNLKTEPEPEP